MRNFFADINVAIFLLVPIVAAGCCCRGGRPCTPVATCCEIPAVACMCQDCEHSCEQMAVECQATCAAPLAPTLPPDPPQLSWPGNPEQLVFAWSKNHQAKLKQWGQAKTDGQGAMNLTRGAYVVQGVNDNLLRACKQSNQLTIEAVIQPGNVRQRGPKRIVTFSENANSRNFTLGQEGNKLVFRLRTPRTGVNGMKPEISLFKLSNKPVHVIVTYRPGELVCYRNGERVLDTNRVRGNFSNWSRQYLVLGDEWNRNRDWSGKISRVAVYSRFMLKQEAQEHFEMTR